MSSEGIDNISFDPLTPEAGEKLKQVKNPLPQGTLVELAERGLDKAQYGSCAPQIGKEQVGCFVRRECGFTHLKGAADGSGAKGPQNFPYMYIKGDSKGGKVRKDVAPCYRCVQMKTLAKEAGDIFRIILKDGKPVEEITVIESEKIVEGTGVRYEARPKTRKVTPHPRPEDNSTLLEAGYMADAFREAKKQEEEKDVMQALAEGAQDAIMTAGGESGSADAEGKPVRTRRG